MSLLDRIQARAQLVQKIEGQQPARVAAAYPAPQEPAPQPAPAQALGKLRAKIDDAVAKVDPNGFAEVRRIVGLPIIRPMSVDELEEFSKREIQASFFEKGFRLFPPQANAIQAYDISGGLFAPIGVGWGKGLCSLSIANRAYKKGIKKILLLVPSPVYDQTVSQVIPWCRSRIALNVPFTRMGNCSRERRLTLAKSGGSGCYILPYSCLSTKDTSEVLDAIAPGLIIADECHYLRRQSGSARTRRLMNYIQLHDPEFVALSGTITAKSIRDYHHLIKAALGNNCPLPLSTSMASDWALVLDTEAKPSPLQMGPMRPLVDWALVKVPEFSARHGEQALAVQGNGSVASPEAVGSISAAGGASQAPSSQLQESAFKELAYGVSGFRRAFRYRLETAPGVTSTGENEIGTTLVLSNRKVVEKPNEALCGLFDKVYNLWQTPNGDEIEHAIHTYKWLYELSAGFYNQLTWPTKEVFASRKRKSVDWAEDVLTRAKEHHVAGQVYAKELRDWLKRHHKPGCDTPMLVGAELTKHGASNMRQADVLHAAWLGMKAKEFPEMPERDSDAKRVCDYKIKHAVEWAKALPAGGRALIWVHHREVGIWMMEALVAAGVPALSCPAGDVHDKVIIDPKQTEGKVCVASITAHGGGKNLQHFQHQLVLQWPRSAQTAEQMIGRTHRNGQTADELVVSLCNTIEFDVANFAATLNDACYVTQSTGLRQKIIYCNYDPLPVILPTAVLHEMGFQNKLLAPKLEAELRERFASGRGAQGDDVKGPRS